MAIVTLTQTEIMAYLQELAQSEDAFGSDLNVSENSDWYGLNWPVATIAKYVLDYAQSRFDNLELRKAEGTYFDGGAANFLHYKKMPDYAISYQMQATNPTIGATASVGQLQIKKENTDIVYVNTEAITVDEVPFTFTARCSTIGEIGNADIGEVNTIQSTPSNWGDTFTNIAAFEGGQDLETTEESRKRFFNQESEETFWNEDGVYAELIKLSGVNSVNVVQNRTDIEVDGVARRAIHIVVDGGVTSEITQAIFSKVLPSTYTVGSEREDITTLAGNTVNIGFDRPTEIDTVFLIETVPASYPTTFTDAVIKYGEQVKIAGYVTTSDAVDYIKDNVDEASNYDAINVTFKKSADTEYINVIAYGSNEKPSMIAGS